jgi:hypothetical protein
MPIIATIGATSGAGRYTPNKPSISHGASKSVFVIDNYVAAESYSLSQGSRTDNTISLATSGTVSSTVSSIAPKPGSSSPTTVIDRMDYTYTTYISGYGPGPCNYLPGCGYICIYCSPGPPQYTTYQNSTPSGYTDSYGEWWRVT